MSSFMDTLIDTQKQDMVKPEGFQELDAAVNADASQRGIEKSVYTLEELFSLDISNEKCLLDPLLPGEGLASIVGKPDSGKSMFCRQLALTIAIDESHFIGLPIHAKHHKAIYVTTEDGIAATRHCFEKQYAALKKYIRDVLNNLTIVFADTKTTDEIRKELEDCLATDPVDLIIIDSFGDVFIGSDSNNNTAMRNTLKLFSSIASRHHCLILFVHHINKAAYNSNPDQAQVQGGSGFVQKVRCVLDLRDSDRSEVKFISVTKGNHLARKDKETARKLRFNENTFLFDDTGERCHVTEIIPMFPARQRKQYIVWSDIFREKSEMQRKDIVKALCEQYGMGERSADQYVKEGLKSSEKHGFYSNPDVAGLQLV